MTTSIKTRKNAYFKKMIELLEEHDTYFVCTVDNVGSKHLQAIRRDLRGSAVILMGKNTLMRRCVRTQAVKNPNLEAILPRLKGNIGLVFVNNGVEMRDIRTKIVSNRVGAPAKAGIIAPSDVVVPKGNTGLEPTQTAFLQALNIASKINKGQIEIINDIHLIKKGDKVGSSEATLLQKLGIRPFSYGLSVEAIYEAGMVYDSDVLDLSSDDIVGFFKQGVSRIACLSLAISFPTLPLVPHAIANAYKKLLSIAVTTDYTFKEAEKIKEFLSMDPEERAKIAAAAAPAASSAAPSAAAAAAAAPPPDEEKEEEDDSMGFGLFD